MKHTIEKIICWLIGHKWQPYQGDFLDPHCVRCGKHPGFVQILRDAARK